MSPRKKRIYLTLIALSALGVVVDRLAGPAPAVGAELAAGAPRAHPSPVTPVLPARGVLGDGAAEVVLTAARFPQALAEADQPVRDLFGPTDAARRALWGGNFPNAGGGEAGAAAEARTLAARFAEAHTLSAVVYDNQFGVAVLDGAWIAMGQELDGCKLTKITGQSAVFECLGAIVELSVGEDGRPSDALKSPAENDDDSPVAADRTEPNPEDQ